MRIKITFIILIFIIFVMFFIVVYNHKLKTEEYISNQLHEHYAVLTHIVSDIRKYCDYDYFNTDELYIGSLLETARNFGQTLNSYENAYNKSQKSKDDNIWRIRSLIDNYYNSFVDAVSLINEVDYRTLDMIKSDLEKWVAWVEENYIYTDKDGHYLYKMYTYDDMVESGLIDELDLIPDFENYPKSLQSSK